MPEVTPDSKAEITKSDGLVILNEECLARSRARGHQILHSQDMGVGDITDMGDIPQILPISDNEWSLILGNAGVDGRD